MTNRRNFIKKATIASVAVALNPFQAESKENELGIIKSKVNKPIVLSTWRFGIQANEVAWKVLNNNGRALDAVEDRIVMGA